MKKTILLGITSLFFAAGAAVADEQAPIELTADQMDQVTAGYADTAYGKIIIDVTGLSFGQLIGPAKKAGTAVHDNYASGAKGLVENVAVHL